MKFYKKVLLTLSSSGVLVACSQLPREWFPENGVVVSIDDGSNYYLDINHDGLVDKRLNIGYYQDIPHRPIFTKYIQAGDTLKYRTLDTSALYLDSCHSQYNTVLDSVNNRSSKDLRYIYEINALRTAAGQPKQR